MGRGNKPIDMIGVRAGRLTVISEAAPRTYGNHTTRMWLCKCDCGGFATASGSDLRRGHTKSCGCYCRQRISETSKVHGMRHTRIYHTWLDIKGRCHNQRNHSFARYGGRGIKVCDEWRESFISFYKHVSELPHYGEDGYSIDRIDNNGNYEPGNVRWATVQTQSRNKRNTIHVSILGKEKTIPELSDETGIKYATLLFHQKRGDLEEYVISKGGSNGTTDQGVQTARSNTV